MEWQWGSQVPAAAGGDRAAFAQIYDMTAALVYGRLIALQVDDAEIRLQEAYLQYWTQLPHLVLQRSMSSVVAWLVQAAVNTDHVAVPPTTPTGKRALTLLPDVAVEAAGTPAAVQAIPKAGV